MKLADLDFSYPEQLVATTPHRPSRVMWVQNKQFSELTIPQLIDRIPAGDVLIINNTKVLKRRVFASDLEILFLNKITEYEWEVLFPSRKLSIGDEIVLPEEATAKLASKGRPQILRIDQDLDEDYFSRNAELPLPPYIQKSRGQRHTVSEDENWYQTAWAEKDGSLASPTASLHFSLQDLETLKEKGVQVLEVTLHVGLGTFLPVTTSDLNEHQMHAEYVEIPAFTWSIIEAAKSQGKKIWALGTTVARTLESVPQKLLQPTATGGFSGNTQLLIQPGFRWQVVDRLLTNFHQPQSTLLALVAGFSDLNEVKKAYSWAIDRKFKLFSYGDLSVWIR